MESKEMYRSYTVGLILAAAAQFAPAQSPPDELEEVLVTARLSLSGSEQAADFGGSLQYIDQAALEKFSYTDINRVLRQVPGVYIQEEEGYGIRPSIALRGSGSDRNAKIAVMEDGVLIAPAPYAAPAAYYFPRMHRMGGIEVSKGAAAIKYGPMTTGGAINLLTLGIPDVNRRLSGKLHLAGGEDGAQRTQLLMGGWLGDDAAWVPGFMVDVSRERADGFKQLDTGGNTGYDIKDYTLKFGLRSGDSAAYAQSLEVKLQKSNEHSNETYLGLTADDFARTPLRRYAASQLDTLDVEHRTLQATHRIELSPRVDLTSLVYRTDTERAWYKLNDVLNGTALRGISAVLEDPLANASAMAVLRGDVGLISANGALRMRHNNRSYFAQGLQSVLGVRLKHAGWDHQLEASARWHEDEEDRLQHDDLYQMNQSRMQLTRAGVRGSQDNRVASASALALYLRDTMTVDRWTLSPGVRYESIRLTRRDYALNDPLRAAVIGERRNNVDVWIPGIAAAYRLSPEVRLIAGAHRGFSSPAPGSVAQAETSWNYEAGVRVASGAHRLEMIGFLNDYENLVGTCTASTGGNCEIGQQFDGGRSRVRGVELLAATDAKALLNGMPWSLPISLAYTYSEARFETSFNSGFAPWGNVRAGDALPYIPEHQLTASVGFASDRWDANAQINFVSAARSRAGQGAIPASRLIGARTVLDLSTNYRATEHIALYATMLNATGRVYNVAFEPAGARPGAPRTFLAGAKLTF
jgi:Fe(3+) dicitrate transport protein